MVPQVSFMLKMVPSQRLTASEALQHPWMKGEGVGDRPLRIRDNIRNTKEAVSDVVHTVTDGVTKGLSTMLGGFSALKTR